LDFRQLRYALSVYKERSFTKAAKRLNISQSAVSEQVKLLEEEIGFELFNRTSGGIESTDRGRTFLYESERVMGDLLSLSDSAGCAGRCRTPLPSPWGPAWPRSSFRGCLPISNPIFRVCGWIS
jgi:DNA-binding transcriptional LysR family regulator